MEARIAAYHQKYSLVPDLNQEDYLSLRRDLQAQAVDFPTLELYLAFLLAANTDYLFCSGHVLVILS